MRKLELDMDSFWGGVKNISPKRHKMPNRHVTVQINAMLYTPHGGYKRVTKRFDTIEAYTNHKLLINLGATNRPNYLEILIKDRKDDRGQ